MMIEDLFFVVPCMDLKVYIVRFLIAGQHLANNPKAAATFQWPHSDRQVRIRGTVAMLDRDNTARFFNK